jgi:hypothetical protein
MLMYMVAYFLALIVGVLASVLLDIQLRRPGLGKSVGLVGLVVLLIFAFSVGGIPHPEWLLVFWAGIGLLAGLGGSQQVSRL